jgi:hypothetical protein
VFKASSKAALVFFFFSNYSNANSSLVASLNLISSDADVVVAAVDLRWYLRWCKSWRFERM